MVDVIIATAITLGVAVGVSWLVSLWDKTGYTESVPQELTVPMSETDLMIAKTQEIITEVFGDDICKTLADMKNTERINIMAVFAERLIEEYGLDVDVDIFVAEAKNCGTYLKESNKAMFNINILMLDKDHELYEKCVRTVLCEIIHELRHAMQWKAINDKDFLETDEATREIWKNNFYNYIDLEVDFRGYSEQPIEADATTFASLVMEGVRHYEK